MKIEKKKKVVSSFSWYTKKYTKAYRKKGRRQRASGEEVNVFSTWLIKIHAIVSAFWYSIQIKRHENTLKLRIEWELFWFCWKDAQREKFYEKGYSILSTSWRSFQVSLWPDKEMNNLECSTWNLEKRYPSSLADRNCSRILWRSLKRLNVKPQRIEKWKHFVGFQLFQIYKRNVYLNN